MKHSQNHQITRRDFLRTTALTTAVLGSASLADWSSLAAADDAGSTARNSKRLWYVQPAANWNEALPLGNGRIGAMVFGGVAKERLLLNEETIWTGSPDKEDYYKCDGPKLLPEIRRLTFEDKWSEAQALFGKGMPSKWWAKYQPMCDLWLEFPGHEKYSQYQRDLGLDTATSTVTYKAGDVQFRRETFISPVDQVLAMRISADRSGAVTFSTRLAGVIDSGKEVSDGGKKPETIGKIRTEAGDPGNVVLRGNVDNGVIAYQARLRVIPAGGTMKTDGDCIRVEGADSAVLILAAGTNLRNYKDVSLDPEPVVIQQLIRAAGKDFDTLRGSHVKEHQRLFNRVSLTLPKSVSSDLPTDERLDAMKKGPDDPALAALLFQFGRYLVISSSRPGTYPPNLQGIWCGDRNPAWDSKYTSNINLQMNYWPVDVANLGECIEPLLRMAEELTVTGGWAARHCFGARGWTLGFNTDLWRGAWPSGGEISFFTTWTTGGAWICNRLYDHYRFTGDRAFLQHLYPVLKGSAEFFLDTLQEHPKSHYLVTCPASSPENRHHKIAGKGWCLQPSVCAGPTMEMQILRELFDGYAAAARELGVDADLGLQAEAARKRLPPTPVGRYGQIQEWLDDWDDPKDNHRHVSMLYGLYPGSEITPDATPDLVKAARVTLEHRGLASTGWSTAWKINYGARLRDGEYANKAVRCLLNLTRENRTIMGESGSGVYPNMFCAHPPFQIDGNFGFTAGVAEMLLQSYAGELHLLPAIPNSWSSGEVKGLCARGGFEADISWNEGKLTRATVRSKLGKSCVVRYGDERLRLETTAGRTRRLIFNGKLIPE